MKLLTKELRERVFAVEIDRQALSISLSRKELIK